MSAIVIIPVYQPEACLRDLVKELWENGNEVLVVDDGSGPEHLHTFRQLEEKAIILHHKENLGKGAAIKTALSYIRDQLWDYDVVGVMDGDGQHTPADIERLLQKAEELEGHLILGVRQVGNDMPLRSRFGNWVTREIFRMLSGTYISDTQSGLRAFTTALIPKLLEIPGERYEYETNVLMTCVKSGIPVTEISIETIYKDKENSTSHFHVLRDSFRIYREFFKFAGSSLLSFCLDYVLFGLLVWIFPAGPVETFLSNLAARVISASANYTMNTHLVFREKASASTGIQYFLLAVGIFFCNSLFLEFFSQILGLPVMGAKLLTETTLFIISFSVQRGIIYRKKKGVKKNADRKAQCIYPV